MISSALLKLFTKLRKVNRHTRFILRLMCDIGLPLHSMVLGARGRNATLCLAAHTGRFIDNDFESVFSPFASFISHGIDHTLKNIEQYYNRYILLYLHYFFILD